MMVAVMTIIGTTASFGNTDGKRYCSERQRHGKTAYKEHYHCDRHKQNCCTSTRSTYCPASSKHSHKVYKHSNVCKYCKKHIRTVEHKNTPIRRRTFK